MQIACRCEKCNQLFMNKEDDLCIEFDFKRKTFSFMCRNKKCNHDNVFNFGEWSENQKNSPLPKMRII